MKTYHTRSVTLWPGTGAGKASGPWTDVYLASDVDASTERAEVSEPWKMRDHLANEECIYIESETDGIATVFLGHEEERARAYAKQIVDDHNSRLAASRPNSPDGAPCRTCVCDCLKDVPWPEHCKSPVPCACRCHCEPASRPGQETDWGKVKAEFYEGVHSDADMHLDSRHWSEIKALVRLHSRPVESNIIGRGEVRGFTIGDRCLQITLDDAGGGAPKGTKVRIVEDR